MKIYVNRPPERTLLEPAVRVKKDLVESIKNDVGTTMRE